MLQPSQPTEITPENPSQSTRSAGSAWASETRFADVLGRRMAYYLDAFIDEVVGTEPLTLVLHDWGGALGFDWAYRHQLRVRAIAYMETFVAPLTLDDLPDSFHPTLKAVRSSAGETLVLDENMFIEKTLPGVTQRTLSADEMAEYRRHHGPNQETGEQLP
jgi:haloalkane dehalogenase